LKLPLPDVSITPALYPTASTPTKLYALVDIGTAQFLFHMSFALSVPFPYTRWADIALLLLIIKVFRAFSTLDLVQLVATPRIAVIVAH
jgi:hypothetical protein